MCMLQLPSSLRHEFQRPWLIRVAALLDGRNYWQAARFTKKRVDAFCIYQCVVCGLSVRGDDAHLVDILTRRMQQADVMTRRDRSLLLWADAFLSLVASHHIDVSTRADQLLHVIQTVAVVTGAFDEMEGEL